MNTLIGYLKCRLINFKRKQQYGKQAHVVVAVMNMRRLRLIAYTSLLLLIVTRLWLSVRHWLMSPIAPTSSIRWAVRVPVTYVYKPEEFDLGLADPRRFVEGLAELAGDVIPRAGPSGKEDRLLEQLRFLYRLDRAKKASGVRLMPLPRLQPHYKDKLILITAGVSVDPWRMRRELFLSERCPITNCYLIDDLTMLPPGVIRPDAVLYKMDVSSLKYISAGRTEDEIWILWQLESPQSARLGALLSDQLPNWTATYRSDSTIVTPYGKFVTSSEIQNHIFERPVDVTSDKKKNMAAGKKKLIAWFVSNCRTSNQRENYVEELKKYAQVDVYGGCGTRKCEKWNRKCVQMLRADYKFYLSFENSNCRSYITEKLYENAYNNDVIPVVMGAHPDDYRAVAPPHSYIHVDDFESPRHLAEYLKLLDKNDTLYNEYFLWKGTGTFINTKFWCRLCAMLHARDQTNYVHTYPDLLSWWHKDQCVLPNTPYGASWRTKHNSTVT